MNTNAAKLLWGCASRTEASVKTGVIPLLQVIGPTLIMAEKYNYALDQSPAYRFRHQLVRRPILFAAIIRQSRPGGSPCDHRQTGINGTQTLPFYDASGIAGFGFWRLAVAGLRNHRRLVAC